MTESSSEQRPQTFSIMDRKTEGAKTITTVIMGGEIMYFEVDTAIVAAANEWVEEAGASNE